MLKRILLTMIFVFVAQLVTADVPNEIRYNGKLKEYRTEVNATKSMNFKLYNQLTGGTAKWESGTKSVVVSSGIFSVVLNPDVDWRDKDYYLEIEIDSKKLEPREKLTAIPYSLHSNTTESATVKENAEFSVTVGNDKRFVVDSSDVKTVIGNTEYFMVPKGGIIIWSGSVNNIPAGWVLCDGSNGTPDLRDRFVLGAGRNYAVDATGGESEHTLTIEEMPSHSHKYTSPIKGNDGMSSGNHYGNEAYRNPNINGGNSEYTGGSQPHNNMPPYYSLCYIMRK
jgi:microcystin-dependent protein